MPLQAAAELADAIRKMSYLRIKLEGPSVVATLRARRIDDQTRGAARNAFSAAGKCADELAKARGLDVITTFDKSKKVRNIYTFKKRGEILESAA